MVTTSQDGGGAGGRPFVDNTEGDILTFSELDLARLGLLLEPDGTKNATQDHRPAPQQQPQYEYQDTSSSLNNNFPSEQLPDVTESEMRHDIGPRMMDPNSYLERSWAWQALSTSAEQSPPAQSSWPQTNGPAYQFTPVVENQGPGLPRRRSRYLRSPTQATSRGPIDIAVQTSSACAENSSDPMQRWRESPPETEAASLSAIVSALRSPLPTRSSTDNLNSWQVSSRPASTVSHGSGTSYYSSSAGSASSSNFRNTTRGRVAKRTRPAPPRWKVTDKRAFPCTFCCDSFKSKYDWSRHEQALHLNLQGWRCAPFGSTVVAPETGRIHCTYCKLLDPTPAHLEMHAHGTCVTQTQIYARKDHLIQHLRRFHHAEDLSMIDSWKVETPVISSRCGFCDSRMETWQERVDHLAAHFRKGSTMKDWKGEHGFTPEIAAQVTDAIPPYVIPHESESYTPFSATDRTTAEHVYQMKVSSDRLMREWELPEPPLLESIARPEAPNSYPNEELASMTFSQFIAFHLGRYAQHQMQLGIIPTDRMFQDEARRLQFGTTDPWERTIADNEDWLSAFRDNYAQGAGDCTNDG
ncbi:hypothetical protein EDB81DRAFT_194704 [Dactylonectria macrodidyma]|uniref:C2H2-type domain-containing protein n=1 Tax=Dactylonectria macrodidyma TaxID=307937 RepID=A0A9P9FS02_9HYPO|nr:hypothetical protein EDB81DRAFT_194704 [Dactylonectria macrodidyma]